MLTRPAFTALKRTTGLALLAIAVSSLSFAEGPGPASNEPPKTTVTAPVAPRRTEPTYTLSAGLDGEIFPVFANYASLRKVRERQWGTIAVKVTNSTGDLLRNRIAVQVPGWSDQEIQFVEIGAGESRTFLFAPTFLPRLYQNREIVAATASVTVTDMGGRTLYADTVPVRLRSVDDMFWGRDFQYSSFIASWVTPHDPVVEKLLGRAKELAPGRRLPGYENKSAEVQERATYAQARAIYRALQQEGVSYVKSSMTFGNHEEVSERVKMPAESLQSSSANCIDGAVLYAAMFENLGMEPVIVLVPGHAYVGVRVARGSNDYLYIETSLTGRSTFEAAVQSAQRGLAKYQASDMIRINVRQARLDGIYPMPGPGTDPHGLVLEAGKSSAKSGL